MSWIKMRSNLQTHPKVAMLAARLKVPAWSAVGALHAVWSLADQHTEDGRLSMNAACLDTLTGIKGIAAAMISVGWLVENGDTLLIPGFEAHQSQSAKARAVDQARKVRGRNADARPSSVRVLSESCPSSVRETSEKRPSELGTREEKRREEKNKTEEGAIAPVSVEAVKREATKRTKPPMPDIPPSLDCANFRAEWVKWLAYRSSKGKPVSPAAATEQFALCQELGPDQAVIQIRDSIRNDWQGLFKPKAGTNAPTPQAPAKPVLTARERYDALPDSDRAAMLERISARLAASGDPVLVGRANVHKTNPKAIWTDMLWRRGLENECVTLARQSSTSATTSAKSPQTA